VQHCTGEGFHLPRQPRQQATGQGGVALLRSLQLLRCWCSVMQCWHTAEWTNACDQRCCLVGPASDNRNGTMGVLVLSLLCCVLSVHSLQYAEHLVRVNEHGQQGSIGQVVRVYRQGHEAIAACTTQLDPACLPVVDTCCACKRLSFMHRALACMSAKI
jgi:hypothetical protein